MTDKDLKQHVQNALEWEPSIDQSDIGVSVDEGVVTLRGNVRSYGEKSMAEQVTLRVYGVKAIANNLDVRLGSSATRTDTDLAQAQRLYGIGLAKPDGNPIHRHSQTAKDFHRRKNAFLTEERVAYHWPAVVKLRASRAPG